MPALPPVTRALLVINVLIYLLELVAGNFIIGNFALWPLGSPLFRPWQLITYAFLHDPTFVWHIVLNMFALYMFGRALEVYLGSRRFLVYYLVCALAAGATQLLVTRGLEDAGFTVGASGGVFGVLLAFAWFFPRQKLFVIPIPLPLPAWLVVAAYALLELFFGVTGRQEGVAHFAHLGGMVGGILCLLWWRARGTLSRRMPVR
ncbi:MAG TPA: rhomboid family intramembrane serine protease [Steroidobacteraceae bacterium]|nr:rhomboid family intramembrane serine protease [Steroidobacteraceae bacterium]